MFKTITTVAAGLALATAGLAGAASATTTTPSGATGTIVASGGKLCLDAAANGTKTGTRVILSTCNTKDKAQQWTVAGDGSLRVHGVGGQCLAADAQSKLILAACATNTTKWLPRGDYTISGTSATQTSRRCITAPSVTRGTQLTWATCTGSASKQYRAPSTLYGSTNLTNRPDSGGGGDNWALDTMTRRASVTWLGGTSYVGSVVDHGSFVTVPGNLSPNQGVDKGKALGDALVGTMYGGAGYTFTAPGHASTMRIPATMNGVGTTGTGDWMKLFFPANTTFGGTGMANSGAEGWYWHYSGTDNCKKTEQWTDSYTHSGQDISDGNITAPAPGTCSAK